MVEVEVGGQILRIASPYDAAYTAQIADYLNAKLRDIQRAAKLPSAQQALILVAFDVIDELLQAEARRTDERKLVKNSLNGLLARVETRIADLEGETSA